MIVQLTWEPRAIWLCKHLDPTKENMKDHQDCIDPMLRTQASRIHMSDVPGIVSRKPELTWLIPIMAPILQHQGTNIRALLYHTLLCRESPTLVPRFDTQTVNQIVVSVIEDQWLELLSDEDVKVLLGNGTEGRDLIISRGKEGRNNLIWNLAGALIQTGEWRAFHSLELAWTLLASFWGMRAPDRVPTCTTWPTLWDKEEPIRLSKFKRHIKYLEYYRASEEYPPEDAEVDAAETGASSPKPKKPITTEDLAALTDSEWNPDFHQALDYLWPIMDESERKSFLDITKTQHSSTSMSAMVSMPSNPQQTSSKASEKQLQAVIDKPEPASGESTKGEEGSKDKSDPQPQVQEAAPTDTKTSGI